MENIKDKISLCFHTFAFIHHVYAWIYPSQTIDIFTVTDQRVLDVLIFAPIFCTSWNLVIQAAYFALSAYNDILHIFSIKEELRTKIEKRKGYIFTTLLFPTTLFVSTMFWTIYSLNREWVLPEVLDDYIPGWLNHSMHTNILLFVVFEVLLTNHLLPTFKSAFKGISIATATYQTVFLLAYAASGRWAYGLFHILTWPERIGFFVFNYFFVVVSVKLGIEMLTLKRYLYSSQLIKSKKVT